MHVEQPRPVVLRGHAIGANRQSKSEHVPVCVCVRVCVRAGPGGGPGN